MKLLLRLGVNIISCAVACFFTCQNLTFEQLIVLSAALGVCLTFCHLIVKPILKIVSIPLSIISFRLSNLFLNLVLFLLANDLSEHLFHVAATFPHVQAQMLCASIVTVVNVVLWRLIR